MSVFRVSIVPLKLSELIEVEYKLRLIKKDGMLRLTIFKRMFTC